MMAATYVCRILLLYVSCVTVMLADQFFLCNEAEAANQLHCLIVPPHFQSSNIILRIWSYCHQIPWHLGTIAYLKFSLLHFCIMFPFFVNVKYGINSCWTFGPCTWSCLCLTIGQTNLSFIDLFPLSFSLLHFVLHFIFLGRHYQSYQCFLLYRTHKLS